MFVLKYKKKIFGMKIYVNKPYQNSGDIFVCYDIIEDEIKKHTLRIVASKIERIKRYDIWKIEIIFRGKHVLLYALKLYIL